MHGRYDFAAPVKILRRPDRSPTALWLSGNGAGCTPNIDYFLTHHTIDNPLNQSKKNICY